MPASGKKAAPEDVVGLIPRGADLIVPLANGEPPTLVEMLNTESERLDGVRIHQMHGLYDHPYLHGECGDHLRHVSYFLSPVTRKPYWDGHIDLVPANFSEMPRTLRDHTNCAMVLAAASPPDKHGYFSLGTNADYVAPLIGHAPFFLEVMDGMPRTAGQNQLHHSQIAGWIQSDRVPLEVPPMTPDARDERIAELVAAEIPDGATIQVGIGGVPNALLAKLSGHRELGVHTELVSDGIMDLVELGVITGTRKEMWVDKIVSTFALGSRRLYDWLDENVAIQLMPVDLVNDPRRIARHRDFMSINATTEVDLFGQCASETVAGRYWSSSGGQADFARGAMYSERGKAFIVLHSTTYSGTSRISSTLSQGSVVTTLKNTVDHVVTEYGIARLRGRSFAERAEALIGIAHPDHREALERAAHESGILRRRSA